MMKNTLAVTLIMVSLSVSACSGRQEIAVETTTQEFNQETRHIEIMEDQKAVLYIGTKDEGFREYPMNYEGDLTPDMLIEGIADLTGWDLTLAEPVITGKGGMSVCLDKSSSIYVGPPEEQKEEFHMFDSVQLTETIQDSIRKTLQMGFTGEGGDPEALEIFYYEIEE